MAKRSHILIFTRVNFATYCRQFPIEPPALNSGVLDSFVDVLCCIKFIYFGEPLSFSFKENTQEPVLCRGLYEYIWADGHSLKNRYGAWWNGHLVTPSFRSNHPFFSVKPPSRFGQTTRSFGQTTQCKSGSFRLPERRTIRQNRQRCLGAVRW
jgi:hypothetical protein